MGQSAWLKTSCATLQVQPARVNGGRRGQLDKPLIQKNLIICHHHGNGLGRNRKNGVESPYKTAGIYAGVYSRPSLIHTQMKSSLRFGLCKRYLQQQKRFPGFSELPAGANAKETKWNRRERERMCEPISRANY